MQPLPDGRSRMMIDDVEFRVFDRAYWDVPQRLGFMNAEGITLQVLSPLPELLGYWLDPATTTALARHTNQIIAEAVAHAPDRLAGLGMLPLQDIELSRQTLVDAAGLGLRGVLVGSNINGVSIADATFHPIFAELEKAGLALFVHGYRPAGVDRLLGSPLLGAIIGVPQDTTAAIASFIATDVLARFPGLKLGFVQGGGMFGAVLDRFDHVWNEFPQLRATIATRPREYVRQFFFDSVTFSVPYLRYLIASFGADTIMAGTDGPTPIGQRNLAAFVAEACDGDDAIIEKVLWKNAARFFDLPQPRSDHVS